MKRYKYILATTLLAFSISSCGDFGDLNVDPNRPVGVATATILTGAERNISDIVGSTLGAVYAQHVGEITYTDVGRYQSIQADFSGWYTGALMNIQDYIEKNEDPATAAFAAASGSNANQIAVGKILRSYFFHYLTDRWGPIPYSEALQGHKGVILPKYDSQEDIYKGIIASLDEALAGFDAGAAPSGDFIFNGNITRWKEFANTIKMQAALRIADVSPDFAKNTFLSAIDGVIKTNIMYPYLAEANNQNPWFAAYITRQDYAISKHLFDYLVKTGDPRLFSFADPSRNSVAQGKPEYAGMPYGLNVSAYEPANLSFPNSKYVKAQNAAMPIYTVAQVEFAKAEAVARGWLSGSAETHFKNAIKASMAQWEAGFDTDDAFETYYAQADVKWNPGSWKASLAQQKWVGLYMQGFESWAEYRRLGGPNLVVGENLLNPSKNIPRRFIYPNIERNINGSNYNAALQLLGGEDSDGTRLWWDVANK
jgi:hypothetical protein